MAEQFQSQGEMQAQGYSQELYSDINTTLRDIEDRQNLLKDRVLLIGENLVSGREEIEKEIADLKIKILELGAETKKIKLAIERFMEDTNNFARKNEVEILRRQFEMFSPLEIARIKDIDYLVKKALKEHGK